MTMCNSCVPLHFLISCAMMQSGGVHMKIIVKAILTFVLAVLTCVMAVVLLVGLSFGGFWKITIISSFCLIWPLILLIWAEKKKVIGIIYGVYIFCFFLC